MNLPAGPNWSAAVGRAFFASAILFFGAQHLIYGEFVTRLLPAWPAWVPGRTFWPYVAGAGLVVAGLALFVRATARRAALILGGITLLSAVLLAVPATFHDSSIGQAWTNAGKALALGGGALVVAASLTTPDTGLSDALLVTVCRVTLGAFLILAGVQHFLWAQFVIGLVPAWIPGAQFWTYFAGVALIAGGLGLWLPRTTRLAAQLVALMVFLWVLLLHIPRAVADLHNANESTAVFEAIAVTGIALLLSVAQAEEPVPVRASDLVAPPTA